MSVKDDTADHNCRQSACVPAEADFRPEGDAGGNRLEKNIGRPIVSLARLEVLGRHYGELVVSHVSFQSVGFRTGEDEMIVNDFAPRVKATYSSFFEKGLRLEDNGVIELKDL